MPSRNISDLYITFQPIATEFIRRANEATAPWTTFITDGLRTIQEQNELYAQGRTKPGNIVTNARGGDSIHNYGLAIDVAFQRDGKLSYSNDLYKKIVPIAKSLGMTWGGDWASFPDKPHFEYTNGLTLKQIKAGARPGGTSVAPAKPGGGMFTDGNNHIVAVKTQGSDSVAVVRFVTGEEYRTLGQPPVQEVPRFNSLDDKGNLNPVILHQSIGDYYFENSELKKQVKSLEEQNSSLDAAVAEITIENNKIAAQYENALAINVATNNVIQNLTLENGALKERVEFLEAQVDNDLTWLDYLKLSISKLLGK